MTGTQCDVLLVEDNPGDVRLAREAFAELDREVHAVTDGDSALECLNSREAGETPRLVLLDLDLPGRSGIEVLRELDERDDPGVPVVVLTNSRARSDVEAAYRARANAYLVKPDDFDEFTEMVESIERFWLRTATLPDGSRPGRGDRRTGPGGAR